ncbi:DUF6470 family protein [Virgibacillus salinus]|uniref:Uncharacterized protein n=1 Tax=Virgibacillus salinus TaxID=553311 RepID=A0A1H0ZCS9_9BACI|nr:DUF6470 family protein [Virgibacillus salinus]SDQ25213.1 hypothetical protein SAMN05216231_1153 [Virgibacillus salinus]
MELPQIRMESQMARIQIQQIAGKQEIQQPQAQISIQQPKAEVSMRTTPSKLSIDQTQAWEDMGLMHISKRIEKFANDGRQGLLEGIARRVQQGAELMKIENDGNPIVNQAATNAHDQMKQLGIKFIPSHFAVKIHYQPSELKIDTEVNQPIINNKPQMPIINYQPGEVSTSMKQYQDLQIDFINLFSESA